MGRILGIDYGTKRVGVAVSDPLKMIANNLGTVHSTEIMDFISQYTSNEDVECFVVGYPKKLNNEPSEAMKHVDVFLKKLNKQFPEIPVQLIDERFTSKMAYKTMIDSGIGKKARQNKALIDSISATIILQNYLDQLKT